MLNNKEEIIQKLVSICQSNFLSLKEDEEYLVDYNSEDGKAVLPERAIIRMTVPVRSDDEIPLLDQDGNPVPEEEAKEIRALFPSCRRTVRNWDLTFEGIEETESILEANKDTDGHRNTGRYHKTAVFDFHFTDDDQSVVLNENIGPLFGRGLHIAIDQDENGNGRFGKVSQLWVS